MSISIIVRRGTGQHPGQDIFDPLISTTAVALARGRNELDEQGSGLQPVELTIPFRPGLRNGQVVRVEEELFGTHWYGKIVSLSHSVQAGEITATLQLRRPTDFLM